MRDIILIIMATLMTAWVIANAEQGKHSTINDRVASPEIIKKMKHHGTPIAECKGNDCWFYRGGRKVNL
jgi:hypothetical protein